MSRWILQAIRHYLTVLAMITFGLTLISATDLKRIRIIPADSLERSRFEELVRLKLAIRGADIDPFAILDTLRLQDMNGLLTGLSQVPFTRKAKYTAH